MTGMSRLKKTMKTMKTMKSKREFKELAMSSLIYDPDFNCRKNLTVQNVATLSEAMDKAGLIHPILVQPWGKKFKLIAGHCRYRAAKLLGWKMIWCDIRIGLTEEEAHILNYTENLLRSDLNMVEEAKFLTQVYPDLGTIKQISLRECARRIDQSVRWIQMRLRLLTLPSYVQEMYASGRLPKHTLDKLWKTKKSERAKVVKQLVRAIDPTKGMIDNDKLPEKLRRRYARPLSQAEVCKWIVKHLDASIIGLVPRAMAMCAGMITQEEFQKDFEKIAPLFRVAQIENTDLGK